MQAAKLFQALKAGKPCRGPSPLTPPMGLAISRDQNKSNLAVAALISSEYLPLLQSRAGQRITTPPGLFLGPRSWVQEMQPLLQRCAFSFQWASTSFSPRSSTRTSIGPSTTLLRHWINPTATFSELLKHSILSQPH